jgi:hypothetical protein
MLSSDEQKKVINSLRKALQEHRIVRRNVPDVAANSEGGSIASATSVPCADRIVASQGLKAAGLSTWSDTKDVRTFFAPLFSESNTPKRGDLTGQLNWLRPILVRADFIVMRLPYFYARVESSGSLMPGGDMSFALDLQRYRAHVRREANQDPTGIIDFRTNRRDVDKRGDDRPPDQLYATKELLKGRAATRVFWDHVPGADKPHQERQLLAGMIRNGKDYEYRWGVYLGHPAGTADRPQANDPSGFRLMNKEDVSACASVIRSLGDYPIIKS